MEIDMSHVLNTANIITKKKLLVHICCSVDSHHFLMELQNKYPHYECVGFFYNPNIHPYEEYRLRLADVERSCHLLNIKLICGEYNDKQWFSGTKGLEDAPEKAERCSYCFDFRLEQTAKVALRENITSFTTTLLASPMKTQNELFSQGERLAHYYGLDFLPLDTRTQGGTKLQNQRAKEANLYRQNYCGCIFALQKQRQKQEKISLELSSSLSYPKHSNQVAKVRQKTFLRRNLLEQENKEPKIIRQKFLCYQLQKGKLSNEFGVIPSFICDYSMLKKPIKASVEFWSEGLGFASKEGIVFMEFSYVKTLIPQLSSFQSLLRDGLERDLHVFLRLNVPNALGSLSISPLIIVEKSFMGEFYLEIESKMQEEMVETCL